MSNVRRQYSFVNMSITSSSVRCLAPLLVAALALGCASNSVDRHVVTTRFILSDYPAPAGSQPFLSVVDARPEAERRYRHEALDTYFGDENLAEPLSNLLRAEVVGQLSASREGATRLQALGNTALSIRHFEFSHKPMEDDRAKRMAGLPPAVQLLDSAVMAAAGGPHRVLMRIRVSFGPRECEAEREYKTGAARPEMSYQMRPYFADLVRGLLIAC
jgi:hypothetical protein